MQNKPQTDIKHPPEWREDLNPDRLAGQNIGPRSETGERGVRTAYDVKEVHRSLSAFEDDELKRIPVLPAGTRLQQGATYLDLADRQRGEFTATGEMEAADGDRYVPKDQVPYELWNRLLGNSE